jgi:tripartite-type tricarboxylate transporter receptor subunit TctC
MVRILAGLFAVALCTMAGAAWAQFPNRLIKIVSPAPPAGGTDIIARLVGPPLQSVLHQTVIVENRGGAGGYLGAEYTAKSAPDGYTLVVGGAFVAITALLHKVPGYDPRKDLIPIAVLASVPNMLVAGPRLKANSVAELIAQAKASPGTLDMASNGVGTSLHLAGELFQLRTGARFVHVPYRGWADAVAALTTGEVDLMFDNVSTALPNVRAGKTRALAITAPERSRALPDVPTLAESGVNNADVIAWFGIMAPGGTPPDVVAALDRAFREISDKSEVQQALRGQGLDVTYLDAKASAAFWQSEIAKWSDVIKAANISAE